MNEYLSAVFRLCVVSLFFGMFAVYAQASEYIIKFKEGAYAFDPSKKFDSLDNKYLASVTITKDGNQLVEVKGSTIPDAVTFYQFWHTAQKIESPSDDDIFKLYEDTRNKQSNIDSLKDAAVIPDEFLFFMYEYVTYTPVLYSGLYKFTIGLHNQGNSVHGKPYVPRLMGINSGNSFSGKVACEQKDWVSKVEDGGFIKTITYNKMYGDFKAKGINIHDGRRTGSERDSAGCLTIDPRDWEKFYKQLPDIDSWLSGKHEGYVVIVRKGEEDLECKIPMHCPPKLIDIKI